MNLSNRLITVLGPTAVGKTKFAVQLAHSFNGEIISADSRQVYIGMDLGTGKDYEDYIVDDKQIKYHLIDIVKPNCEFNLYLFTQLFNKAFLDATSNNKLAFLVGGTGLYLSSIIQKYSLSLVDFNSPRYEELEKLGEGELIELLLTLSPELHNTTDLLQKQRIIKAILVAEQKDENSNNYGEIENLVFGLYADREIVKERIRKRLRERLKNGMIEEVETLVKSGVSHEKLRFFGLEYKFISMYLTGELNYNDMSQKLASAIIQFSKRQMTWFRKMEKEGVNIHWLKNNEIGKAEELINKFLTK